MQNRFDEVATNALRYSLGPIKSMHDIETISQSSSSVFLNTVQDSDEYQNIHDISELPFKNEHKVVCYMRSRYINKKIYTWAGQTLIAVHPYEEVRQRKYNLRYPSINAVVHRSWFHLENNLGKQDQMLVLSGESGSGKTYSACLAMKYVALHARNDDDNPVESILWQVWSSVPLLSAFGNAPTIHNMNSSRFGKLLLLQYANSKIIGAHLKTYLLEKSRVTNPNKNEGNYHIFRQVLDSLDDETLSTLYLNRNDVYKIAPKLGIKSAYTDTIKSLEILSIHNLDEILVILAIILNLGNICFELNGDAYAISEDSFDYAENVVKLLHTTIPKLVAILCNVQIYTSNGMIYKSACLNYEECLERRNCIMKLLYNQLFTWLVESINAKVFRPGSFKHLGILDVYGFEMFETNTFEQLCINYANERLQQYFLNDYLIYKRRELIDEGFDIEMIDTYDYVERVALIDGPVSIFGILNEECITKRFNNDMFVNARFTETLRGRRHFLGTLNDLNTTFSIKHYAGVVKYDAIGMLAKNRDKVPEDVMIFLQDCQFDFLRGLLRNCTERTNAKPLLNNFKKSLDDLMKILDQADAHYIKCLKPNPYKICDFFEEDYFKQQLIANGIFEVLKLNFQKYSIKLPKNQFFNEYGNALYSTMTELLPLETHESKHNIYITERAYQGFKLLHRIKISIMARRIQYCWLRFFRKRYQAAVTIQSFYRRIRSKRRVMKLEKFMDVSQKSSNTSTVKEYTYDEYYYTTSFKYKIEHYLSKHRFEANYEGDQLSLRLERVFNSLHTKPFKRILFCGDRIVSYNRLAEIPVRLHTSKTCIRYSYLLPQSELPKGLPDIF